MPVTPQAMRLQAQLDAAVASVTNTQQRELVAAWVYAWSEVSADLADTLTDLYQPGGLIAVATIRRSLRLRSVLSAIASKLDELAAEAGVRITSDLTAVVNQAAKAQRALLASELPGIPEAAKLLEVGDRGMDAALEAIVERTTGQITSLTKPLSASADAAVRRELVRAIAVGDNPKQAARRMVRRAEGGFNGGLTRAMTISRTELLDAHRAAAAVGQGQHTDVLAGWVWLAHLDQRTCPACLVRNGTLHETSEAGPEGHQNCRCARMPKTKSWADLGFDVEEPEDAVPDARAWFDSLSEPEQVALLGRRRLDLLNAGDITWDEMAQLRHTPGWRKSWAVTPLHTLTAGQRRSRAAS